MTAALAPVPDDVTPRAISAHVDGARPRTEVLWINPAAAAARRAQALPLFAGERS